MFSELIDDYNNNFQEVEGNSLKIATLTKEMI